MAMREGATAGATGSAAPADAARRRTAAAALAGLFAATIYCGSFLLFLVQPILAKELLPRFGGAASVWATCLVFFQSALLLGYAGADALSHLPERACAVIVPVLALGAALVLPIIPAAHWQLAGGNPAWGVLGALAATVGLPYVLIATTSPLVQAWHARCLPGRSPYRLYALSNLASLLALFSYPAAVEPWVGTHTQARVWSAAYVLWAVLIGACALAARNPPASAPVPAGAGAASDAAPGFGAYLRWSALSGLGSWLLVALTNHLTRDVAAIPLLWILPLAAYLLSFIIAFGGHAWLTRRRLLLAGIGALLIYAAFASYSAWPGADDNDLPIAVQVVALTLVLTGACLLCNGRLALTRPAARHLTRFYLTLAFGGALGAVLVALAAPALFNADFDLEIGMGACAAALLAQCRGERLRLWLPAGVAALATLTGAGLTVRQFYDGTVLSARNFYGTLRVFDWNTGSPGTARSLAHGVIVHGTQYLAPALRRRPTEYYGPASGVGHAMAALQRNPAPLRIGVIGLGAGTMAAYGRRGDVVRFYEINPAVIDIAEHQFSFLRDSPARIELARGDARLTLAAEPVQNFDLLVVDAFSGDSIPVHLLTREALDVYLRHMKPGGLIAFHLSNLYLDLVPVVQRLAQAGQLSARLIEADDDDDFNSPSSWVLVSTDARSLAARQIASVAKPIPPNATRLWTDDFSDLLRFLHQAG